MTKLNDFLGKTPKKEYNHEKMYGNYGCQQCNNESEFAYWDQNAHEIFWICDDNHKSVIHLD